MHQRNLLDLAGKLQHRQQAFAWVTVLHALPPTSARAGDKALVLADGTLHGWIGGGCAKPSVIEAAQSALNDGKPRRIRIAPSQTNPAAESSPEIATGQIEIGSNCVSGGSLELFIDPIMPMARLAIFGESAVAQSLLALAPKVGFDVTLISDGCQAEDFPDADRVLAQDGVDFVQDALGYGEFVVVASQGRRDRQALAAALALQPRYIWLVASGKKAGVLKQNLIDAGEDAQRVAAIIAPAGSIKGATTPEEIALSVLADVVAKRRHTQEVVVAAESNLAPAKPSLTQKLVKNLAGLGAGIEAKLDKNVGFPPNSCCG
ncbi:MAG: XdhC family protein [Candidatus Symbiobacter sp.]|nr:XdhC family protein [Candidatus Symbiobacter sp.]